MAIAIKIQNCFLNLALCAQTKAYKNSEGVVLQRLQSFYRLWLLITAVSQKYTKSDIKYLQKSLIAIADA